MSQIKLKHSGGNSVIIAAPDSNPASDRTLKLPSDGDGTILTTNSATGKILQVVSTHKTDVFTTAATSPTDVTGLSAAITPSSTSNKVFIIISVGIISNTVAGQAAELYLLRGSTQISIGDAAGSRQRLTGAWAGDQNWEHGSFVITFLDSPSTTSATTYKLQMCTQGSGTACLNRRGDDPDAPYGRGTSSFTVMEVAA